MPGESYRRRFSFVVVSIVGRVTSVKRYPFPLFVDFTQALGVQIADNTDFNHCYRIEL